MRLAIAIGLQALLTIAIGSAQQDPAQPPQASPKSAAPQESGSKPADGKPSKSDEKTPAGEKGAATAPGAGVDPMKMAAPKGGNRKPAPSAVDNHQYILGPEDQISVFCYQDQSFTNQHMIRPDGKITISLLGDVQASGLTPEQLAKSISEKLTEYVNDPDVTVSVLAVKSKKYSINGEVNRPGEYPLVVPTRVFQALVNAGGFRDFANQKKITVIHEDNTRDFFNYKEVLAGKKLEQNIWLKPGDIIVVK